MREYILSEYRFNNLRGLSIRLAEVVKEHAHEPHYILGYLRASVIDLQETVDSAKSFDDAVICETCGFPVELLGHSEECPDGKEDPRHSMPDGPVGNADGYTDGEEGHDPEECTDPRCEEPECRRQRELEAGERRADERREAGV